VSNVIVINGKKYDAATGKLLTGKKANGTAMDGMVKKTSVKRTVSHSKKTPQKSKTLMRNSVKKPAKAPTRAKANPTTVASVTKSSLGATKQRQHAATSAKRSPMISHFGSSAMEGSGVVKKIQHMPVKKHPSTAKPRRASSSTHTKSHAKATATSHNKANSHTTKVAAAKMIETALANSTSHEQAHHPKQKRHHKIARKLGVSSRAVAISSTVLAGVLLGGFFAVQNIPNLSMRVAAARAGFDATLPDYKPSGFSFSGPINYRAGQVSISFSSNTDDRNYEVVQRSSNWSSEALLANFVAIDDQSYQTYEDKGRTLYIYGSSNATWVDNGIWYQVEGNSRLTTDQLVRLAASM